MLSPNSERPPYSLIFHIFVIMKILPNSDMGMREQQLLVTVTSLIKSDKNIKLAKCTKTVLVLSIAHIKLFINVVKMTIKAFSN